MKRPANSDIPIQNIHIKDEYWDKYRGLVGETIIPYQWEVLNDLRDDVETSHCIKNFKAAAGLTDDKFEGAVFQDTDLAKWLEAVGFYLAEHKDAALEKEADEAIELIGKAQQEDGYLDTYFILNAPEQKWKNLLEGHELYTAGHMIEAAVAYYEGTGKKRFIEIVCKLADLIDNIFGTEEGKCHGYPGHPEIELALVKLYRVTGEKRYLNLAKYFIDQRGVGENYFVAEENRPDFVHVFPTYGPYDTTYGQNHLPVREQKTAEGHSVRAGYLYTAMADVAEETSDEELLQACEILWEDIVKRRMYITGSIGSSGWLERFSTDYDLPNDINYSETCATISLAMFSKRMNQITHDAKYADIVELSLYNSLLSGIAMDGKSFFYVNPLEVWPDNCVPNTSMGHVKPVRQKWFGVACCPPNIARTLASLGQYIYCLDKDSIYVNLFISNETDFELNGTKGTISIQSKMPWQACTKIIVSMDKAVDGSVYVRIPDYAKNPRITRNGSQLDLSVEKGYVKLDGPISKEEIVLDFAMPAEFIHANPFVRADIGKVALVKGPIVYCVEEEDNGKELASIYVNTNQTIEEKYDSALLGGSMTLSFEAKKMNRSGWDDSKLYAPHKFTFQNKTLKAIPYPYWDNRKPGEMYVWMKEII